MDDNSIILKAFELATSTNTTLAVLQEQESRLAKAAKARIAGLVILFKDSMPTDFTGNALALKGQMALPETLVQVLKFETEKLFKYINTYYTTHHDDAAEATSITVGQAIADAQTWLREPNKHSSEIRNAITAAQNGARIGRYSSLLPDSSPGSMRG